MSIQPFHSPIHLSYTPPQTLSLAIYIYSQFPLPLPSNCKRGQPQFKLFLTTQQRPLFMCMYHQPFQPISQSQPTRGRSWSTHCFGWGHGVGVRPGLLTHCMQHACISSLINSRNAFKLKTGFLYYQLIELHQLNINADNTTVNVRIKMKEQQLYINF